MEMIKIDAREILFIKQNLPHGLLKILAININMDQQKVRNVFNNLRNEYPDDLVIEARRLLKETTGLVYNPELSDQISA